MKLLLHTCCAPCSIACVKSLREEKIEPHLFWYNPNIHPYTEYITRRDCLNEFAGNEHLLLTVYNKEYSLLSFLGQVFPKTKKRCYNCLLMRLEKTAFFAASAGFTAFTTTLLISPHQDHDEIKSIGEALAKKYSIDFLYRDFRPLFREGQDSARSKGYYMQKYCGCIFSEEERFFKTSNGKLQITDIDNKQSPTPSALRQASNPALHTIFDRVSLLTGNEGLKKLKKTSVLVFGAGGVGSWAAEALVRSGIGKIGIIDNDSVCETNLNRQLEATTLTLGMSKASALKKRLLEINPACEITIFNELFCLENSSRFCIEKADYVIDAIDTLNHKLDLIETTAKAGVTLYSSMGMALKMDPLKIKTASIWKTDVCPLARHVRNGLKKRGFQGDFTTVYSVEKPAETDPEIPDNEPDSENTRSVNGSIVTVTGSAGLMLASLVINDVIG